MSDPNSDLIIMRTQIEELVLKFDPVELLLRFSRLSNFVPLTNTFHNWTLRETPIMYVLTNLCLCNNVEKFGSKIPGATELEQIFSLVEQFITLFTFQQFNMSNMSTSEDMKSTRNNKDSLIFSAKIQKLIGDISASAYIFQTYGLVLRVFDKFEDYFINNYGFSVQDAWNFGVQINDQYQERLNEKLAIMSQKGEIAIEGLLTEDQLEFGDPLFTTPSTLKEVFVFTLDEFCSEKNIENPARFRAFLDTFACAFGDEKAEMVSPLEEGLILTRPIIKIDQGYFVPIPANLLSNLPIILERLLDNERRTQSKTWQKFQTRKADFTDESVFEYFARIFPKGNVVRNVTYIYQGKLCEVDMIIKFDNKLFIIENKSSSLTPPAKRGAIDRLRTDLKKLIGDAYKQCRRTQDYISSVMTAEFFDKSGKTVMKISYDPKQIHVFLVNLTLENLMSFAADLKSLECIGLYDETVRLWSVSLFELDIITRHIPSPTILIHYLERRLDAQKEGVFRAFDELSFYGWYLDTGNFYIPLTDDGKVPDLVAMDGWVDEFDNHYLFGAEAPVLKLEPEIIEMIQIIESQHMAGYSDLACAILDLPHKAHTEILGMIRDLTKQTREDRLPHDFSLNFEKLSLGLAFMSRFGHEDIEKQLAGFCILKKYETKVQRWIGIGKDATVPTTIGDVFFYIDFDWEHDPKLDRLVDQLRQKRIELKRTQQT